MTQVDVKFSVVHYRPDPSRPAVGAIPLGVLVEVEQPVWALALQARAFLREKELARMDGIGRELLARPFDHLREAVESVLAGTSPTRRSMLDVLAERHEWSISISCPKSEKVSYVESMGFTAQVEAWTRERFHNVVVGTAKAPASRPDLSAAAPTSSGFPVGSSPNVWELPRQRELSL